MVISADWSIWRQSNSSKVASIKELILDDSWWDFTEYLLKFTEPILSMIQYTDMDRPFLDEVYDGIDSMIEDIRNIINEKEEDPDEKFFKELQVIMVEGWNKMTTHLHLLAFALSPKFYSQSTLSESTSRVAPYRDPEVSQGYKELQVIMVERWNKMTAPLHLFAFVLSPRFYSQSILSESTGRVSPYRDPKVAQGYKGALQRLFPKHLQHTVRFEFMSFASIDDCGLEALADKKNVDAHKW